MASPILLFKAKFRFAPKKVIKNNPVNTARGTIAWDHEASGNKTAVTIDNTKNKSSIPIKTFVDVLLYSKAKVAFTKSVSVIVDLIYMQDKRYGD
ncbi:MAG: hypothetical protein H7122_13390 [Chitinophagaceae bacterium]|nr:hypothetical protein [Chitinophagaceae bacterium]